MTAAPDGIGMRAAVGVTAQSIVRKKLYLKSQSNSHYSVKLS
jgi:hypothetical protein